MLAYLLQVVVFLLALIGAFFKCVREDGAGRPIRSRLGLPIPTVAGGTIFVLLLAAFGLSSVTTYHGEQSSAQLAQQNAGLQTMVQTLGKQLTDLATKLDLARSALPQRENAGTRSIFKVVDANGWTSTGVTVPAG